MVKTFDYTVAPYETGPFDVTEEGEYHVLTLPTGEFVKVSSVALNILSELQLGIPFSSVTDNLQRKYDLTMSESDLELFVQDFLIPANLLRDAMGENTTPLPRPRNRRLWLHISLLDGRRLGWLARPLTVLFQPTMVIAALGALLGIQGVLFLKGTFFLTNPNTTPSQGGNVDMGLVYLIVLLSQLFHEFGHIVSCYYFKVQPRGIGVGLYFLFPVFFTDMSEVWTLDRKKRLVTDLAGVYFQCLTMLVCSVWLLLTPNNTLVIMAMGLTLVSTLMNLNPVLRFDGYWIFIDLLGIPNVNQYAWRYLKTWMRPKDHVGPVHEQLPRLRPRLKAVFAVYCVLYALGTTAIFIFATGLGIYVFLDINRLLDIFWTLCESLVAGNLIFFFEYLRQHSMYLMAAAFLLYLTYMMGKVLVDSILSGKLKVVQQLPFRKTAHQESPSSQEE